MVVCHSLLPVSVTLLELALHQDCLCLHILDVFDHLCVLAADLRHLQQMPVISGRMLLFDGPMSSVRRHVAMVSTKPDTVSRALLGCHCLIKEVYGRCTAWRAVPPLCIPDCYLLSILPNLPTMQARAPKEQTVLYQRPWIASANLLHYALAVAENDKSVPWTAARCW